MEELNIEYQELNSNLRAPNKLLDKLHNDFSDLKEQHPKDWEEYQFRQESILILKTEINSIARK